MCKHVHSLPIAERPVNGGMYLKYLLRPRKLETQRTDTTIARTSLLVTLTAAALLAAGGGFYAYMSKLCALSQEHLKRQYGAQRALPIGAEELRWLKEWRIKKDQQYTDQSATEQGAARAP